MGLVSATDRDDDVDGIVEYLMVPNNDSKYFHLGRRSGRCNLIWKFLVICLFLHHFTVLEQNCVYFG